MNIKLVSIIILYYNDKKNITNCIESILNQTYSSYQIIFIDNGSNDQMIDSLEKKYGNKIEFYKLENNLGYCGGNNYGLKFAKGDYLLFLNSDVILEDNYIELIINKAELDPSASIFCGKILRADRKTIDSTGLFLTKWFSFKDRGADKIDRNQYQKEEYVFGCCGAALFISRNCVTKISSDNLLFDQNFFAFMEDGDVCYRAQIQGMKSLYLPSAIAYHVRGASSTGQNNHRFLKKSKFYQYLVLRNRYFFIIKNVSFRFLFHYILHLFIIEFLILIYIILHPKLFLVYLDVLKKLPNLLLERKTKSGNKINIDSKIYKSWILKN